MGGETASVASEAALLREISAAEKVLVVARHAEELARGQLTARASSWQNVLRLSRRAKAQRCERRGRRSRATRRARVVARVAAKLASFSGDSGDPEPEPPRQRRHRDSEVTP
jgi:hypothetical protein